MPEGEWRVIKRGALQHLASTRGVTRRCKVSQGRCDAGYAATLGSTLESARGYKSTVTAVRARTNLLALPFGLGVNLAQTIGVVTYYLATQRGVA